MPRSRNTSILPRLIWRCNTVMCAARASQALASGVRRSLFPANSATAATAPTISHCCRFLICTFASLAPDKAEAELQRGGLPAGGPQVRVADLRIGPQALQGLQQGLVISCRASANDRA